MLWSFSILDHADISSDAEMTAYGVGVMLVNIGMYAGAPALSAVLLARHLRRVF